MSRPTITRGLPLCRLGLIVTLPLLACVLALPSSAADNTPPVLQSYSYSPLAFSVSSGDTALTGSIQASDDSSGLNWAFIAFYSPSQNRRVDCHSSAGTYSGTLLAGSFTCAGIFPRYTETGTWSVQFLSIADKAGNVATYTMAQLAALGFSTSLILSGQSDLTPPSLLTYTFSPASFSIASSPVQVTGTIAATDDLSGLYHAFFAFYSPSGNQRVDCYAQPGDLAGGTPLNGAFNCSGTFQTGLETGTWSVHFASVADTAGNTRIYTGAELSSMGLPTTLSVSNTPDVAAPVLTSLTLNPLSVNTVSGPANITGVAGATDLGVGIRQAVVALFSPSGQQRVDCTTAVEPSGTLSASMPCNGVFPQNSESGAWQVRFVTLSDHANNTATVEAAALAALGAPSTVNVTGAPLQPQLIGLSFTAVAGAVPPIGQQFQVLGSDRPWTLLIENGSPWISLSPPNGFAPALVTMSVNHSTLNLGVYHDVILIKDVINNLPAARLPVTLTVVNAVPLTAAYFEMPLFDSLLIASPLAGEPVTAFVYLYWPAIP